MPAMVSTPMITPTLLRARCLDEPDTGIPQAETSDGGRPATGGPPLMAIMKNVFVLLFLVSTAFAASPRFEDYPANLTKIEKITHVILPKEKEVDWKMADYLHYADVKDEQRLDFADRFTLFHIGCGTGCHEYALIDRVTGVVYPGGYHQEDFPSDYTGPTGFEFHRNSRLLIIRRAESFNWPVFVDYFVWEGTSMRLITTEIKVGPIQPPVRTPVDRTPAVGAPVAPPSGAAGR